VDRGALAVKGNHDAAVAGGPGDTMHETAVEGGRLDARPPVEAATRLEGCRSSSASLGCSRYASPERPREWIYITDPTRAAAGLAAAAPATWVFCGHVHEPVLYTQGAAARPVPFRPVPGVAIPVPTHRRWLAVVGSAGQPRDGNTAACYAMLDTDRPTLTFHRVPYDWRVAAAKIRAAGLPESLARRLERGE
jgi:diadenosine tetraphosphatase ApaH/serine/threonine PP2A family protein phosphatase